ncbi:MAG TPA: sulfite exporter TauE/SafE family protein [Acidiferrobacteraceae bacterium]|nr:sulfite exporter TauE/SafE family protein [Acidiferrobacteraceae bacterium]HEX20222.1 sulfite exporter TauE/SafE family protein [Acidiferrobacteraceae bacterium]
MEGLNFIDLNLATVILLLIVGFIGGMVSGFIGSGGAFVLTPAMMALGVPGIVAVASNMAHKFPKALVASIKRARYGQVDIKLGIIMGVFAEAGVFYGKEIMIGIRASYGNIGTDLYVSVVFIVVLAIVGGLVLRDAIKSKNSPDQHLDDHKVPKLAKLVRKIRIPGTMMRFKSLDNESVSLLFIAPLGFATGMLAAFIAVGGFVGVPAMIYVLGVRAIHATATELVVAFVMGTGGSLFYAWEGFVDIRLSLIILAGSLFGVQIGAIGTTYVKEHMVKLVMGMIMVIVLVSRLFKMPVYLSELKFIEDIGATASKWLSIISFGTLAVALIAGALVILAALLKGMIEHRKESEIDHAHREHEAEIAASTAES